MSGRPALRAGESLAFLPNGPLWGWLWLFTLLSGLAPMSRGLASGLAWPSRCSGVALFVPVGAVSGEVSAKQPIRSLGATLNRSLQVCRQCRQYPVRLPHLRLLEQVVQHVDGVYAVGLQRVDHVQQRLQVPSSAPAGDVGAALEAPDQLRVYPDHPQRVRERVELARRLLGRRRRLLGSGHHEVPDPTSRRPPPPSTTRTRPSPVETTVALGVLLPCPFSPPTLGLLSSTR